MIDQTGGAAFPLTQYNHEGMSLLDYFAAHALVGVMSNPRNTPEAGNEVTDYAREAYRQAVAMLMERSKYHD